MWKNHCVYWSLNLQMPDLCILHTPLDAMQWLITLMAAGGGTPTRNSLLSGFLNVRGWRFFRSKSAAESRSGVFRINLSPESEAAEGVRWWRSEYRSARWLCWTTRQLTVGLITTWMGDCLRTNKPTGYTFGQPPRSTPEPEEEPPVPPGRGASHLSGASWGLCYVTCEFFF